MSATDVFMTGLNSLIASFEYFTPSVKHVADVATENALPAYWRLAARPRLRSACPFDLIVHGNGRFDIAVGPEVYEGLPAADLTLLQPLLQAIVDGAVVTRSWTTAGTGQLRRIETMVSPKGREMWRQTRDEPAVAHVPLEACIRRDHHYTPYMRDGGAAPH